MVPGCLRYRSDEAHGFLSADLADARDELDVGAHAQVRLQKRLKIALAFEFEAHHGFAGFFLEQLEKLARDAKLLELGAGTTDINLLSAARQELGIAGGSAL